MLLVLLKISNVAIIFVICAVYFVSYAECVPYPTESPEYYSYLNKIAKARKVHETKVYLEQKVSRLKNLDLNFKESLDLHDWVEDSMIE